MQKYKGLMVRCRFHLVCRRHHNLMLTKLHKLDLRPLVQLYMNKDWLDWFRWCFLYHWFRHLHHSLRLAIMHCLHLVLLQPHEYMGQMVRYLFSLVCRRHHNLMLTKSHKQDLKPLVQLYMNKDCLDSFRWCFLYHWFRHLHHNLRLAILH